MPHAGNPAGHTGMPWMPTSPGLLADRVRQAALHSSSADSSTAAGRTRCIAVDAATGPSTSCTDAHMHATSSLSMILSVGPSTLHVHQTQSRMAGAPYRRTLPPLDRFLSCFTVTRLYQKLNNPCQRLLRCSRGEIELAARAQLSFVVDSEAKSCSRL